MLNLKLKKSKRHEDDDWQLLNLLKFVIWTFI